MKIWKVENTGENRPKGKYRPDRWEKKTKKYWLEQHARKLIEDLNRSGYTTKLYVAEVGEWIEVT